MNDMHSETHTNGAGSAPMPPFNPTAVQDRARVSVSADAWNAASDIARGAILNAANSLSIDFDGDPDADLTAGPSAVDLTTEPLVTGGEAMDRFTKQLRILGIAFEVVAEPTTTAKPITLKEAAGQLQAARAGDVIVDLLTNKRVPARIVVGPAVWNTLDHNTQVVVRDELEKRSVASSSTIAFGLRVNPIPTDTPDGLARIVDVCSMLKGLAVEYEMVGGSDAGPDAALESRVLIGRQAWARVKQKTAAKVMAADRDAKTNLSTTPTGAMMTDAFPKDDVRIVAFTSALDGLKVPHQVITLPPGEAVVEPVEEPATKTPRGSARKARRSESEDEDDNGSFDVTRPHAMAESFRDALKVALKAAPRRTEAPAVSFVVIAGDPDRQRLIVAARDGRRWHEAYVPVTEPIEMLALAIQLKSAKSLLKSLDFATKESRKGSRIGFYSHTGDRLRCVISCGKPEPMSFELKPFSGKPPEGWEPPRFSRSSTGATIAGYDAKSVAEAMNWPGGAACMKKDDVDGGGRRHMLLVDQGGVELLRAVLLPVGLTEGLPEDAQLEIDGALSPAKKKRGGKGEVAPTGPAVKGRATGQWRLERSADGKSWATETTGTESEVGDAFARAKKDRTVFARSIDPQGLVGRVHEGKPATMGARDKAVAKPAKKTRGPKFESNVSPTGARKPARLPKPAKKGSRAKR